MIVCECGDLACIQQIVVAPEVYEETRREPTLFLLVPGHELEDVETLVRREPEYVVVRKDHGLPKRVAEETDPRGDT
jgi:hypothetical protein